MEIHSSRSGDCGRYLIDTKARLWPEPFIQCPKIIGNRITALRHIADGHPAVSPIGTNCQKIQNPQIISTALPEHLV